MGKQFTIEELKEIQDVRDICVPVIKELNVKWNTNKSQYMNNLNDSIRNSINASLRTITYSAEYLDGYCLLPDEIHPERLVDLLIEKREYDADREAILHYAALLLKRRINEFYRNLKKGVMAGGRSMFGNKKHFKEITKKCNERIDQGIKTLRN